MTIRASRSVEREQALSAHLDGLRAFGADDPATLRKALRASRRAAWRGGADYDPIRHAALLRLLKRKAPP